MAEKNVRKKEQEEKKKVDRPYPRVTLENAVRVVTAIKDKNAGNPWPPEEVAKALNVGAKTGPFWYLTAGARDYSLTEGTSRSEKISLTGLGRKVVFPKSPEEAIVAKREAFLSVDVFRKVLEYYKGSALPEKEYLSNTLRTEFHLEPETHDEFVEVFQKNCKYLGIGNKFDVGTKVVHVSPSNSPTAPTYVSAGSEADGPVCFVIMPFVERDDVHSPGFFNEVLTSLIIPAAKKAGFVVRTANRHGSDVIQSTIVNELLKADLVVADLTEHNPNVLFELGMRMREDKPVALIKATGTGRIFDVDNMLRVVEYDSCLWPSTLASDLPKLHDHIRGAWENRNADISYMKLLRQAPLATVDIERQF
jgi:hypothetical protein